MVSPGAIGMALVMEPDSTTWPGSSDTPSAPMVFASQARALNGVPRTAA